MGKGQVVTSPSPLSPWGHFPLCTGAPFLAPGDSDIAPCGESVSSPSLAHLQGVLCAQTHRASEVPSPCVCSSHTHGPVLNKPGGLSRSVPVGSLGPCQTTLPPAIVGVSFWSARDLLRTRWSPQGVSAKACPALSAPHLTCRTGPYREAYPQSTTGNDVGPRRSDVHPVFSRCPPKYHDLVTATPPLTGRPWLRTPPKRVRAVTSVRGRTRTGRMWFGRTAPFET